MCCRLDTMIPDNTCCFNVKISQLCIRSMNGARLYNKHLFVHASLIFFMPRKYGKFKTLLIYQYLNYIIKKIAIIYRFWVLNNLYIASILNNRPLLEEQMVSQKLTSLLIVVILGLMFKEGTKMRWY